MVKAPVLSTALVALAAGSPLGALAQAEGTGEEVRVLRSAAIHEARGRFEEARQLLVSLLEESPESSAAIFALERVLTPMERLEDLLPFIERYQALRPNASGVRHLHFRVLAELDSVAALRRAVEAWVAADSTSLDPYREGARILEQELEGYPGTEAAGEILRRGQEALGSPVPLAIERGAVLLRAGDVEGAAAEWSAAIGSRGEGGPAVLRRVVGLRAPRAEQVVSLLLDALDREPTTVERRRAGIPLALRVGMERRATELARRVVPELEDLQLRGFLAEIERMADGADAPRLGLFALEESRRRASDPAEQRALDERIMQVAVDAGEEERGIRAGERLVASMPPRSEARRAVLAEVVRLEAVTGEVDAALRRFETLRAAFPEAPEMDALASLLASELERAGRSEEAEGVLAAFGGPLSSMTRAFLLFDEGRVEAGKEALTHGLPAAEPAEATSLIQILTLLDRLGSDAAELVARAAALERSDRIDEALALLGEGVDRIGEEERPAVLAHAARTAEAAGFEAEAAEWLRRLVERHPGAPEAAEAVLALARWEARDPSGVPEAMRLLEELIVSRPDSPLVPSARRELERLGAGSGEGGR